MVNLYLRLTQEEAAKLVVTSWRSDRFGQQSDVMQSLGRKIRAAALEAEAEPEEEPAYMHEIGGEG
jgi:hypothetical protein